tara:strand:+ start:136 stop:807 length:672 start_codon:yes stop_codon:yes gene_type:complete
MMTGKITTMEVDDYSEYSADSFAWNFVRDELTENSDLFSDELEKNPLYSIFIFEEGKEEPIDLDCDSYEFADGKTDAEFYMIIGEDKHKKEMVENYKHNLRDCMTQKVYEELEMCIRNYNDEEDEWNPDSDEYEVRNFENAKERCEYVWDRYYDCIIDSLDDAPLLKGLQYLRGINKKVLDELERDINFMAVEELSEDITYCNSKQWKFNMKDVKKYVSRNMY